MKTCLHSFWSERKTITLTAKKDGKKVGKKLASPNKFVIFAVSNNKKNRTMEKYKTFCPNCGEEINGSKCEHCGKETQFPFTGKYCIGDIVLW